MQSADRAEFLRILNGLAAIKPNAKLTDDGLDMWWQCMADWSIDEFRSAASHLAKACQFMPLPYDFEQLRKAGRPTAGEAWARALEHVRAGGTCNTGDDLLDRTAAALGGWRTLGMTNLDSLHFVERRFCEHFEAMQDATDTREAVPQIAGSKRLNGPRRFDEIMPELSR